LHSNYSARGRRNERIARRARTRLINQEESHASGGRRSHLMCAVGDARESLCGVHHCMAIKKARAVCVAAPAVGFIETASKKLAVTRQYLAGSTDENASLASACINHRLHSALFSAALQGRGCCKLYYLWDARSRGAKMLRRCIAPQLLTPKSNVVEFMQAPCVGS
jgi:hypothetical protein